MLKSSPAGGLKEPETRWEQAAHGPKGWPMELKGGNDFGEIGDPGSGRSSRSKSQGVMGSGKAKAEAKAICRSLYEG